jgi:hypothetical protein
MATAPTSIRLSRLGRMVPQRGNLNELDDGFLRARGITSIPNEVLAAGGGLIGGFSTLSGILVYSFEVLLRHSLKRNRLIKRRIVIPVITYTIITIITNK